MATAPCFTDLETVRHGDGSRNYDILVRDTEGAPCMRIATMAQTEEEALNMAVVVETALSVTGICDIARV